MVAKRKAQSVVKTNVTVGQLLGTGVTLLILIATSYVNLEIKVNSAEVRQANTDAVVTEIKTSIHEIQVTQTVILEKLGALEARADDRDKKK